MTDKLSHVDDAGAARMVDVSAKPVSARRARATGTIRMRPETLHAIMNAEVKKGDVLGIARVAGIMAAKRTAELIPLCHPLTLDDVQVAITPDESIPGVRVEASVATTGRTGAEMEALTSVAIALLTVYDMAKAIDRGMELADISLHSKTGGVGGEYARVDGTSSAT